MNDRPKMRGSVVVTRKAGESILIGDQITVTNVGDSPVTLAIRAPKSLSIDRVEELLKKRGLSSYLRNNDGPSASTPEPSAK